MCGKSHYLRLGRSSVRACVLYAGQKRKFDRSHTQPERATPEMSSQGKEGGSGSRPAQESHPQSRGGFMIQRKRVHIQPYEKVLYMLLDKPIYI